MENASNKHCMIFFLTVALNSTGNNRSLTMLFSRLRAGWATQNTDFCLQQGFTYGGQQLEDDRDDQGLSHFQTLSFLAQFHTEVNIRRAVSAPCRIATDLRYQPCSSHPNNEIRTVADKRIHRTLTTQLISFPFHISRTANIYIYISWQTWKLGEVNVFYIAFIFHLKF